jgi:NADP-dependent 3-hydroxy acid dehydrogenase YdfG
VPIERVSSRHRRQRAGIGLETAWRARAEGASVILTGRNSDRLKQAARELGAQRCHQASICDCLITNEFKYASSEGEIL